MHKLCLLIILLLPLNVYARLSAPQLQVNTEGLQVRLKWSEVKLATGYRLLYAPYPFQGVATIDSIDLKKGTDFSIRLWQKAAYYVAVQAYDANLQNSAYSNIAFINIRDRGKTYRSVWRRLTQEIDQQSFTSDHFLYKQLPDSENCFAGRLNTAAQNRQQDTLNAIRKLHRLPAVSYANQADHEVQQAALIQKANNFLSHTPATNALCYSKIGYAGSNSSNLHLENKNGDPADHMIGFVDDAFNLSTVAGVGHRRALLNPFLQFTSYGQVQGASAVKVFDFATDSISDPNALPDFIAFPYLRYPYVFFSDKTSNKKTPWSLSIIEDKLSLWKNQHHFFAGINLSVRKKESDQLMQVDNLHIDTKASGVPNNLSWTVANWEYDTWYSVKIDNIRYLSGETGSLQYDVFIDYKNIIDITAALEAGDQLNNARIQGTLSTDNDKDSYTMNLEGNVTFAGSSQFSNMGFYIALYDADKQLLLAKDEPFTLDLIAGRYTLLISQCYQRRCYSAPKNYSIHIN